MTCSIDGASQKTYQLYRVGGDFERVIDNIRRINAYKKLYNSPYPVLNWQYIVFGYNEHEIAEARALANDLGMNFNVKLSWNPEFSPVKDIESVRLEVGAADRKEYKQLHGSDYAAGCCEAMWNHPQINWDGRILGCPRNFWGDYGANVFTNGLYKAINSQQIRYARAMLHGLKPSRQDIPCSSCDLYLDMKATERWFKHTHNSWLSRMAHSICQSFRPV